MHGCKAMSLVTSLSYRALMCIKELSDGIVSGCMYVYVCACVCVYKCFVV